MVNKFYMQKQSKYRDKDKYINMNYRSHTKKNFIKSKKNVRILTPRKFGTDRPGPDVISGGARFCRENFRRRSFLPRKRPSLGHGFYYYLLLLLIETDYNAIALSADRGICG